MNSTGIEMASQEEKLNYPSNDDSGSSILPLTGHISNISQNKNPSLGKADDKVVYIPDLFSSIMAVQPDVNINYEKARFKGDEWIKQSASSLSFLFHAKSAGQNSHIDDLHLQKCYLIWKLGSFNRIIDGSRNGRAPISRGCARYGRLTVTRTVFR